MPLGFLQVPSVRLYNPDAVDEQRSKGTKRKFSVRRKKNEILHYDLFPLFLALARSTGLGNPLQVLRGGRNIHHEKDEFGTEPRTGCGSSEREKKRISRRQNSEPETDSR